MGLDLRIPVGLMFTLAGLILTGFGLATCHDNNLYAQSLGININIWWGLVLLTFGLVMSGLGVRTQMRAAQESPCEVDASREGKK